MDQADEPGNARLTSPQHQFAEQRRPEPDPHPPIADADGELGLLRVFDVADVAGSPEALAGLGIDRDQRLVADVIDRCQVVEQTIREPRLGGEEAQEERFAACALKALSQPVAVRRLDRPNQRRRSVAKLDRQALRAGRFEDWPVGCQLRRRRVPTSRRGSACSSDPASST
jgi:hypothetical protein